MPAPHFLHPYSIKAHLYQTPDALMGYLYHTNEVYFFAAFLAGFFATGFLPSHAFAVFLAAITDLLWLPEILVPVSVSGY